MNTMFAYCRSGFGVWLAAPIVAASALIAWNASGQNFADWPVRMQAGPYALSLYEPRIEQWHEPDEAEGRAVIAVAADQEEPVFGTVWFNMQLRLDEFGDTATVLDFEAETIRLPAESALSPNQVTGMLQRAMPGLRLRTETLRQSYLHEKSKHEHRRDFAEQSLTLIWSPHPTLVVQIDGEPRISTVPGTFLLRVVNTESLLLFNTRDQHWYLALDDHWRTADGLHGEWLPLDKTPEFLAEIERNLAWDEVGEADPESELLVIVTEQPMAVIVTDGRPLLKQIDGTALYYAVNTDADMFFNLDDRNFYALYGGRWFATDSPQDGLWEEVASTVLPETFADIPFDHPKYSVLVHVPGTPLAEETFYDMHTPVVRAVVRQEPLAIEVEYTGEPLFDTVADLGLYYAVNTRHTVVRVQSDYYLCFEGAWYRARSPRGPWLAAVVVPSAVYRIPIFHPLYPITFVRVYDWTPNRVYVGYTAGYLGWIKDPGHRRRGLVVNYTVTTPPVYSRTTEFRFFYRPVYYFDPSPSPRPTRYVSRRSEHSKFSRYSGSKRWRTSYPIRSSTSTSTSSARSDSGQSDRFSRRRTAGASGAQPQSWRERTERTRTRQTTPRRPESRESTSEERERALRALRERAARRSDAPPSAAPTPSAVETEELEENVQDQNPRSRRRRPSGRR